MKGAIVAVGREILTGKTLDTNSHWLAGRLMAIGIRVKRICVVDDVLEEIARELSYCFSLGLELVITTGGLGPTEDDMTLASWAQALGREMVLNPQALEMVRSKYQKLYRMGYVDTPEMTPQREKMAWMPKGAQPLPNSVGAAPGMFMREGSRVLVALPGVPDEMKAIFSHEVQPLLVEVLKERGEGIVMVEEVIQSGFKDESLLGPLVRKIMASMEGIYLKTLATHFGPDVDLGVRVEAWGKDEREARDRLKRAVDALEKALREAGSAEN